MTNPPGIITAAAGFRGTVCEPAGSEEILRVIRNEEDEDARLAAFAREGYESAVGKLIARLRERDFELLIDLILSRTGFPRLAELGRTREGLDIEAQNATSREIVFVQVKSWATQAVLDDYVSRFQERRDRYDRMIFAVLAART
jgi:Restriction endonuclease